MVNFCRSRTICKQEEPWINEILNSKDGIERSVPREGPIYEAQARVTLKDVGREEETCFPIF